MDGIDWNEQLIDQLDWYWQQHFRPRLHSLSDDEDFWEPVLLERPSTGSINRADSGWWRGLTIDSHSQSQIHRPGPPSPGGWDT